MNKCEAIGVRQTKIIKRSELIPYSIGDAMIIETDRVRLPRAERTLTHLDRYKLKEAKRDGARASGGVIVNLSEITGRSKIGQ